MLKEKVQQQMEGLRKIWVGLLTNSQEGQGWDEGGGLLKKKMKEDLNQDEWVSKRRSVAVSDKGEGHLFGQEAQDWYRRRNLPEHFEMSQQWFYILRM